MKNYRGPGLALLLMLSTPAFVRVSHMNTSPRSSLSPTQYVIRCSCPLLLDLQCHMHPFFAIAEAHARYRRSLGIVQPRCDANVTRIWGNTIRDVETDPAQPLDMGLADEVAVLAMTQVPGVPLADCAPGDVSAAALHDLWTQVARFQQRRQTIRPLLPEEQPEPSIGAAAAAVSPFPVKGQPPQSSFASFTFTTGADPEQP